MPPFCLRCNHPLRTQNAPCPQCRAHPLHLDQIRAVAYHSGVLRKTIHALKYKHCTELTAPLAVLLHQHLQHSNLQIDVIVAVPLHPERQRARGYNQAELLAREIADKTQIPYIDGLKRIRATADQIGLNAETRHENMRGAFTADVNAFRNQRVLLIDDVCTTGATLDSCAVALLAQAARKVYGLTVARPH